MEPLTREHIVAVCMKGMKAETCAYLALGPKGWMCGKHTHLEPAIREKLATDDSEARGDCCEGRTGWVEKV